MRGQLPGDTVSEEKISEESISEPAESLESEFLVNRQVQCPVCWKNCVIRTIKNGKLISVGRDMDLHHRYKQMEPVKYHVDQCPHCGYASLLRTFFSLKEREARALREQTHPSPAATQEMVDRSFEEAFRIYRAALRCSMIKQGEAGERGQIFLYTAWLLRSWREEWEKSGTDIPQECEKENEQKYLHYALDCFQLARARESFPIAGMDESTFDYLISALAFETGDFSTAGRMITGVLQNRTISSTLRVMAEDLKDSVKGQTECSDMSM